ncbi:MAG TPA: YjbE family putative metal transport protein [Methylomirabilota bacterium]|nr:YjbE family putative metal transport protein [Methylomirabilota bacterium]
MIGFSEISALLQVVMVDLVLAGDNAIVVGMVAAGLPRAQRGKVIFIGIVAATLLRVVFAVVTSQLLQIIGLTLAGGILLLWVCWKLWRELRQKPAPDADVDDAKAGESVEPPATKTFRQAVTQIVLADVSMSLDNVLAVAGVARDHTWVLVVGLVLSVAFMGAAAALIAGLLKRFHWIAYVGLAIIFYVACHMIWDGSLHVLTAADKADII